MTRLVCLLLTLALWLFVPVPCPAQPPPGPLVVVLLPGTNLADWRRADAPSLHRLMANGALAVMNTRTARLPNDHTRESPESASLTLGAGSRAAGGPEALDFQSAGTLVRPTVTAGDLFTRRTGTIPSPNSLVNVQWPRVARENQGRGYDIRLGNLADALASHGIVVYARGPTANAVATSGHGIVAHSLPSVAFSSGNENRPLTKDQKAFLTDHPPALDLWDAGNDPALMDYALAAVVSWAKHRHGRVIIISPSVSDAEYARGERLAPVLMYGEGVASGLLYSPSTHQAGLVTNTDFAPTITAFFGAKPNADWLPVRPFGGSWLVRPAQGAETRVPELEAGAYAQSRAMRLLPYLAITLGFAIIVGTVLYWKKRPVPVVYLVPTALILALVVSSSAVAMFVWFSVILTLLLGKTYPGAPNNILGMAAIVAVLVGDMCLGDPLMRRTMLGYSAVEGARYYGIGNEAMGALVGASLVVAARLWRPGRHPRNGLVVFGLAIVAALLGSPFAGAKAGGLLVAVGSFLLLVWRLGDGAWSARALGLALGAAAIALGTVAVLDLHGGQHTHVGRALGRILDGGLREAGDIIQRKLAVECRLLYHSAWAIPLWAAAVGLAVLRREMGEMGTQSKALGQAGGMAVLLCLAFNDAGTVAAALCAALLWSALLAAHTNKGPRREKAKIASHDAGH